MCFHFTQEEKIVSVTKVQCRDDCSVRRKQAARKQLLIPNDVPSTHQIEQPSAVSPTSPRRVQRQREAWLVAQTWGSPPAQSTNHTSTRTVSNRPHGQARLLLEACHGATRHLQGGSKVVQNRHQATSRQQSMQAARVLANDGEQLLRDGLQVRQLRQALFIACQPTTARPLRGVVVVVAAAAATTSGG